MTSKVFEVAKKGMIKMMTGNPYQFAVLTKVLDTWNEERHHFNNGVLLLCVGGEYFPKIIFNTTLSCELRWLIDNLKNIPQNIPENEALFCLPKENAFRMIEHITYPYHGDIYLYDAVNNDYRYQITIPCLEDNGCSVYAVRKGDAVRFLAAHVVYNRKEVRKDLSNLAVSEAIVPIAEVNQMVSDLEEYWKEICPPGGELLRS